MNAKWNRFIAALHIDFPLLLGLLVVSGVGLVVLYSAGGQDQPMVVRQMMRIGIGLAALFVAAQIPPQQMARWAFVLYGAGILLLVLVLFLGTGRGAQRWLDLGVFQFQPSEIMKLAAPMMVAAFFDERAVPPRLPEIGVTVLLIMLPTALVIRQPDLGTAILIAVSGFSVLFLAGIQRVYIFTSVIVMLLSAPLLWFVMHDYQRARVLTLLEPEQDPLGAGYHIIQSKIAVGSGGAFGKGWLDGTQSHLEFLPERSTDFIFAVICEEFGFVGAVLLVVVYMCLVGRGFVIALHAQGTFPRLFAASIVVTFFVYLYVNMGMVIGQLPVVGVPLPLISYGGTSVVTLMTSFGILMSIHTHKRLLNE